MPDPPVRGSPSIDPPVPNRPIRAGDGSPIRRRPSTIPENWRDLQAFQLTFLAWFKQKDAEDPESPHWYNPYEDVSTSRKSFDIKEAPRYQERSVPLKERLALIGLYALTTFSLSPYWYGEGFAYWKSTMCDDRND